MELDLYYPNVKIEIITEKDDLVLRGIYEGVNVDSSDIVSDVLSVMTKRSIGTYCPVFSITLVFRNDWFHKLGSNDLVIIHMARPPEKLEPVFYGLLDDIRKTQSFANGKPIRTLTLTGRGFCKAFLNFEVGTVKEAPLVQESLGYVVKEQTIANLSAAEAVKSLIDVYTKKYINYNFGSKGTLLSLLDFDLTSKPQKLTDASGILEYQGSLWNLLKELQNAPFNEMFWDIKDSKPTLIMRPTPFDKELWEALESYYLDPQIYIDDDLGKSDLETYTMFSVSCRSYIAPVDEFSALGAKPLWYEPYYNKYGIKRLEVSTLYANYADISDAKTSKDVITNYAKDLFNWNIKNNSMVNGTISVMGSNKYKIGTVLTTKENGSYYIESVTHKFTIYDNFTTQLGVTRGLGINQRFEEPWGGYKEFHPEVIVEPIINSNYNNFYIPHYNYVGSSGGISNDYILPDITGTANLVQMPYYNQYDPRWKNKPYGYETVGSGGCGVTSLAMVVEGLTGKHITPDEMAYYSSSRGHYNPSAGTSWSLYNDIKSFGIYSVNVDYTNVNDIINNLREGNPIISSMKGYTPFTNYTSGGHLVVLKGVTSDGKIIVNDPASTERSNKLWSVKEIMSYSKHMWAFGTL